MMSAEPTPVALPWVRSVRLSTAIFLMTGPPRQSTKRLLRPVTLGSKPVPLISLPISSITSTSISSKKSRAIFSLAMASSSGSRACRRAAGMHSMSAVSSWAFSTAATPNRNGRRAITTSAASGSTTGNRSMPWVCSCAAPLILPMPIASILVMPLSIAPRNVVCGLIRLMSTMPSAAAAMASA